MNRQLRRLGAGLIVGYLALFAMVNYVQVVRASDLNNDGRNSRAILRDFDRARGQILSADGLVLACTVESSPAGQDPLAGTPLDCSQPARKVGPFALQRLYPERDLFGHLTGFLNVNFGAEGVERFYNDELAGQTPEQEFRLLTKLFVEEENTGDLTLTIRKDVQEAARQALGERRGSVVALDPRNGGVLALWSFPSYDPNPLSSHDGAIAQQTKTQLEADPNRPLRGRTWQEVFFPGSTFKTVTASVGVDSGKVTPANPVYPSESAYDPPDGFPIRNFGGSSCGGALFAILRVSCNASFARMGAETLGPDVMAPGVAKFGFNERPPIDLPATAASPFPSSERSKALLGQASIGQFETKASPLQMALVSAAVANKGTIMTPHVLAEVRDSTGDVITKQEAKPWKQAISDNAAATMRQAMIEVVQRGTARRLAIPGVEVGAKTGTAQTNPTDPNAGVNAWIIGFAGPPGGEPTVAVAVIVEAQQGFSEATGGRVAAPIARQVIEKVLETQAAGG